MDWGEEKVEMDNLTLELPNDKVGFSWITNFTFLETANSTTPDQKKLLQTFFSLPSLEPGDKLQPQSFSVNIFVRLILRFLFHPKILL